MPVPSSTSSCVLVQHVLTCGALTAPVFAAASLMAVDDANVPHSASWNDVPSLHAC